MDVLDFTPWRIHDIESMWLFAQQGYCDDGLKTLNCCQMFLQVIWLSDICTGDSKEILQLAWSGKSPFLSAYTWPRKPSNKEWGLWQTALTSYNLATKEMEIPSATFRQVVSSGDKTGMIFYA